MPSLDWDVEEKRTRTTGEVVFAGERRLQIRPRWGRRKRGIDAVEAMFLGGLLTWCVLSVCEAILKPKKQSNGVVSLGAAQSAMHRGENGAAKKLASVLAWRSCSGWPIPPCGLAFWKLVRFSVFWLLAHRAH